MNSRAPNIAVVVALTVAIRRLTNDPIKMRVRASGINRSPYVSPKTFDGDRVGQLLVDLFARRVANRTRRATRIHGHIKCLVSTASHRFVVRYPQTTATNGLAR